MYYKNLRKSLAIFMMGAMCLTTTACGGEKASEDDEAVAVASDQMTEEKNNSGIDETIEGDAGDEHDTSETEAAETTENAATADDSLWGTKKLASGKLTMIVNGADKPALPITFEYAADGSYKGTLQDGGYDYVFNYTPKGVIIGGQVISYSAEHPNGKIKSDFSACYGINSHYSDKRLLIFDMYGAPDEAIDSEWYNPKFDDYGNLIDTSIYRLSIPETGTFWIYADVNPQIEVEKTDGLVSKVIFTKDETLINGATGERSAPIITYYTYNGDEVIIKSYKEDPEGYDEVNRTFGTKMFNQGIKVVRNSHGVPAEICRINEDDSPSGETLSYEYDPYGNIVCIMADGVPIRTIEYEYEDGTVTKYE